MENAVTWSNMTLKQKYNAGLFIVISTLTSLIIFQHTEKRDFEKTFNKRVAENRIKDSSEIAALKADNKYKDDKYLSYLEAKEKKYSEMVEQLEFLKQQKNEK